MMLLDLPQLVRDFLLDMDDVTLAGVSESEPSHPDKAP
jgi:hypothetical protein